MENETTAKKEFVLSRTFKAPKDLVWKAYTEAEHMSNWWGPKGFKMISTKMDFRPGGSFLYGMVSPDGHEMWGKITYRAINPKDNVEFIVAFSNPEGEVIRHPMAVNWPLEILNVLTLKEKDGYTTLTLRGGPFNASPEEEAVYHASYENMNQGFKGTFDQLEEYLVSLQ